MSTRKDSSYTDVDHQYADLLKMALDNVDFRDCEKTAGYYRLPIDDEFRRKYEIYAYMVWNFLETIYDREQEKKDEGHISHTWFPVILEENRLHYTWFKHNLRLFKEEFQRFIIETVNDILLMESDLNGLKEVYGHFEQDFPYNERKPLEHLIELYQKGRYSIILAKHEMFNKIIGYAFVYNDEKTLWLDYMAIEERFQNAGYGTLLFNRIMGLKSPNKPGMYIEVEKPGPDDSKNSDAARRIRFYERLGAQRLPIDYELPTEVGPFPMFLYFKPAQNAKMLPAEEMKQSIESVFGYIHSDIADASVIAASISPQDVYFTEGGSTY